MRFVNKRFWFSLACLLSTPALFQLPANAGVESITPSDSGGSGVADNFAPRLERAATGIKCSPENNLSQLEQQIAAESGQNIQVAQVGIADIPTAVQSTNDFIRQLDAQELEAISDSPTFMSLLDLLREANTSFNSNPDLALEEAGSACNLFSFSPAPVPAVEPEIPITVPEVEETPEPPRIPTRREPIRGLW